MSNKPGTEVVKAREFDVTQYGKWMAGLIGLITPAIFGVLKLFKVEQVTTSMVIAALAVTAVAIFSASIVIAVDMLARAMVTRDSQSTPAASGGGAHGEADPPGPGEEVRVTTKEKRVSRG
jgi:hypothetical protein